MSTTAFSHAAMLGKSDRSFWWVSCRLPSAWMYLSFLGLLRRDPSVEGCILCQKIFRGCAWDSGTRQSALFQRKLLVLYDQSSDPPSSHSFPLPRCGGPNFSITQVRRTAMCPWLTSLVKNEPLLWAQFVTGMHLLQIHPPGFLETPMPLETRFERWFLPLNNGYLVPGSSTADAELLRGLWAWKRWGESGLSKNQIPRNFRHPIFLLGCASQFLCGKQA